MKERYLNQEDARDIRNMDELLSRHDASSIVPDADLRHDLWIFFRRLRVRLDKAGDKTRAWQRVKPGGRTRANVKRT